MSTPGEAAAARPGGPRHPPDYALGSHVAPLGLAFYRGAKLPAHCAAAPSSASTARGTAGRSGYKVVFVPFAAAGRRATPSDFLTGFLDDKGEARGRPVGVAMDQTGGLLVADDVGNVIWRVAAR